MTPKDDVPDATGRGGRRALNLYYSSTGNTAKVARAIDQAVGESSWSIETVEVRKGSNLDVREYDLVFLGSGVYHWLPGQPMMDSLSRWHHEYFARGELQCNAPRLRDKWGVLYCTYGGTHTGVSEARPCVEWLKQFLDHLGITALAEWLVVGEFHENLRHMSLGGRLGDIRNRPNDDDLRQIREQTHALLRAV